MTLSNRGLLQGGLLGAAILAGALPRIDSVSRLYAPGTDQRSDVRRYYASTAEAALEGRGWRPSYPTNFIPPPGQALFIYALKRLAPGIDYQYMRSVQALISILTIVAAFGFARALLDEWAGVVAAGLVALDATLWHFVGTLLPETNYVFLLFCFGWALTAAGRRKSLPLIGLSGILLGLACLFKPVPTLLGGVVAVWLAISRVAPSVPRGALVFVLAFLLPIAPWILRNRVHHGYFYPISTNGGTLLAMANSAAVDAARPGSEFWDDLASRSESFDPEIEARFAELRDAYGKPEENLKDRAYMRRALGYIASHPIHFARNYTHRLLRFVEYREPNIASSQGALRAWLSWAARVLGMLGLLWLAVDARSDKVLAAPLILVGYLLVFGALWPLTRDGRMNLPFQALLAVPAAYLIVRLAQKARGVANRSAS